MMGLHEIRGQHALVSGASSSIGRDLVAALLDGGAEVSSLHRTEQSAVAMGDRLNSERHRAFVADLRQPAQISRVVEEIAAERPPVDMLINLAGVWHDDSQAFQGPELSDTPPQQIVDVLEVGVVGAMLLTAGVLRGMKGRRSGNILFFSCGFAGPHEAQGWVHYYTANHAVNAMVEGIAAECRSHGIRVNAIAPWFVATDWVTRFYPDRVAEALEVRDVVEFAIGLLSPASRHISGQVIEVRSEKDV
jgi:NAD(P)-dependent dehydrogenase (short-subunit alcohol dehydrogenase family)